MVIVLVNVDMGRQQKEILEDMVRMASHRGWTIFPC